MRNSRIEVQGAERLTSNLVIAKIMRLFCFDSYCGNVGDESGALTLFRGEYPKVHLRTKGQLEKIVRRMK